MHLLNCLYQTHCLFYYLLMNVFWRLAKRATFTITFSEIDLYFLKNILFNPCLQSIILVVCYLLNTSESSAALPIVNKSVLFWQRIHRAVFLFLVLTIHNLYFLLVNHSSWNTLWHFSLLIICFYFCTDSNRNTLISYVHVKWATNNMFPCNCV